MVARISEARRALLDAARSYLRAKDTYEKRREEVHAAIIRAVQSGETKSQVARDTGYTREYVTELVKEYERRVREDGPSAGEPVDATGRLTGQ